MHAINCFPCLILLFILVIKTGANGNCDMFSIGDPEKQEFYSPNYPKNYPNNMNCSLQLTAPPDYLISIEFYAFKLQLCPYCNCDQLQIAEGNSTKRKSYRTLCEPKPPVFTSKGNQLYLTFITDQYGTESGFRAAYKFLPDRRCDKFSIGDQYKKEFYSPLYPEEYDNNLKCELQLTAPSGYLIRVEFHTFELQGTRLYMANNEVCHYDYLEFFEGNSTNKKQVGMYCGKCMPPVYTSNGRQMFYTFVSDDMYTHAGFRASYQFIVNTRCNNFSIGDLKKKEFYSPFYPSNYDNNMNCDLELGAPLGYIIRLAFHEFSIERHSACNYDYIQVNEGNFSNHTLIGQYCGGDRPKPITSKGPHLFLRFKSDSSNTFSGFRASYTFLDINSS